MSGSDVLVWPDDYWCYRENLLDMTHRSDDYQVLIFESPEWLTFIEKEES